MLTKNLSNRIFDYINPWGEIISSIVWAIRSLYHSTLKSPPAQLVFGRDMIFNMSEVVDWKTQTINKQTQVDRDNLG